MQNESPGTIDVKRTILQAVLVAVIAAGLFSRVSGYGFVNYDDPEYVYENPHIAQGLTGPGLRYALTTCDLGTWAPLTWLSYECDASIFGLRPGPYHCINLFFHSAAGVLLFLALRLMRQSLWVAGTVAALFLVHPLRMESVVWIAERKDVLCAFFWMAGLAAYSRYARRPSKGSWCIVFLCTAAGLMSKMMMVTFPIVLLLLDCWPLRRVDVTGSNATKALWHLIREKIPFFLASLAALWISARALESRGAFGTSGSEGLLGLLRVPENYLFYLEKIFWPSGLALLYPLHPLRPAFGAVCGLLLVVATGAVLHQATKLPWLAVGWVWFLVTLVPVAGFVPFGDFNVADRYSYLPSVGILWAVAGTVEVFAAPLHRARWALTLGLGTVCAALTWAELPRWRDSLSLFNATLKVGEHYVSYTHRGAALLQTGDIQGALADFEAAIRLNPHCAAAYNNRGIILSDRGRYEDAIQDFNKAIQYDAYFSDAYDNRANTLAREGQPEQALADYDRCIKLDPGKPLPYNNRAAAFFELKRFSQAQSDLQKCLELGGHPHPGLVQALKDALEAQP